MNFITTIGLEVHIELNTKSKIFSPSPDEYGDEANNNTNVIDWGYPGVLPTTNKQVVADGITAALALHSKVNRHPHFDRKNYFYPDNPKAYQITQHDIPDAQGGYVTIHTGGKTKKITLTEMHIEEDAGKNTHGIKYSYVDLNRQGAPLIEIVSDPVISSPQEAYDYLETLRQIILFSGISDVKMEEGSMRADVNISVRPIGQKKLNNRIEMKNVNSFNYVKRGLEYEEKRQRQILMAGGTIQAQTRRFNENTGKTTLMRTKENADDYRYFPEPDLPSLDISDEWINELRDELPEMPSKRKHHYVDDLGLSSYDANVLTQTKQMSDFFDQMIKDGADAKMASNYLQGNVSAYLNSNQIELKDTKITPKNLTTLINLVKKGTISTKMAKKVFKAVTNGVEPNQFVKKHGMVQLSDPSQLKPIVDNVLTSNPQSVDDFHNGKDRAKGFLVGQVMKKTRGKANPQMVSKLLSEALNK
ncbi:aspartyl/glutamyl-tRNA(Asn/Gln) amidotransferase subunit B [Philodulcilactobacillus myokoensis]|uniref:Aspartyl/glutamyl-tRNA(Asn/Gln) amidotransferase subunit B n=1 Tax=Philodulcilactobacillus myokoensis TaxID=2929573 RepID=A0A9W6B0S0_9LACO|nr:Asp-tRNA(Asn)/Glu-tRNA(Gln) amidotransferase subunit GatB [Philodulcilactobacillus myokoensis]GLB46646.1 aspartyl/glutamyl-tRNA(Asn/Gln) amidotransferase subunit B [Philodulcilactobacillus myokoensis]